MVLVSLALAYWVSLYWLWLTVFVGANLVQSAFTNLCPAEFFLRKLGCSDKDDSQAGGCCCG